MPSVTGVESLSGARSPYRAGLYVGSWICRFGGLPKNGEMQLYEMIFQQYNHPSVVMWGLFADQNTVSDDPTSLSAR